MQALVIMMRPIIYSRSAPGLFEYTFLQPIDAIDFKLKGNKVVSHEYTLRCC